MNLTLRGWLCLILGVGWTVLALLIGEHDLVWPGLFLALLPVLSLLWLLPGLNARVQRTITDQLVPAGVPTSWTVDLAVSGFNPGAVGELTEQLPPAFGGNWYFSYVLGPNSQRFTVSATPRWRGRHLIGPATWRLTQALGLARVTREVRSAATLVVTPRVHLLEPVRGVSAGRSGIQTPTPRSGSQGSDDALVREYRSGDDFRRIHWPSSARTGELMVRREEHAWDPDAVLLLDARTASYTSPVNDQRLEAVISLAASIGCHLLQENWSLTLVEPGNELHSWPGSGSDRSRALLLHLTDVTLNPATDLPRLGTSGELLIALLGRLTKADALELIAARRDQRHCWALVMEGHPDTDPQAVATLRESGWSAHLVSPRTPPASAWQLFAEVGR
ncbi:MAG: DUF58 domain-containing protein [Propionibacteriaceae bacterium]|jgi:uncharacterized protein (DUF58 family)|nr:DUF58 domain-containing protein [Propionibacteriaceae bacterium]